MTAVTMTDLGPILPSVPNPTALPAFLHALRTLDMSSLPENFDPQTLAALSLRRRDWAADRWAAEQAYLVYDLEALARGESDGAMRDGSLWDGTTREAERIHDALDNGPVLIDPPQPFALPLEEFQRVLGVERTPARPWALERWMWAAHQRDLHKAGRDADPQLRRGQTGWAQHTDNLGPAAAVEADRFAGRVRARLADAQARTTPPTTERKLSWH